MSTNSIIHRMECLDLDMCLTAILQEKPFVRDGVKVKVSGGHLRTYLKGTRCVSCGVEGVYFALERVIREGQAYRLVLYALDKDGNEIQMSSDHIVPVSKGGIGTLENRQPMCSPCNQKKGNKLNVDPNH